MPTVAESSLADTALGSTLKAVVDTISLNQSITFVKYIKFVLPLDGFVFWVRAAIVSPSAVLNSTALNRATMGQSQKDTEPPPYQAGDNSVTVMGSIHYATMSQQTEIGSVATNQIVFTSEDEVKDLNEVGPLVMYIGSWQGVRFSFAQRRSFYQQADLWHYTGNAIYSTMETQIIDLPGQLDTRNVVVSNSLPFWLSLNQMQPPFPYQAGQRIPLYPSFAVPENLEPPYGSVHVDPNSTEFLQLAPYIDKFGSHWQLCEERVVITLQGLRNFNAMDFLDYVLYVVGMSEDNPALGIMNSPVIKDEKDPQVELQILSQRKQIEFRVNYYQQRMRNIARQLIDTVVVNETIGSVIVQQTIDTAPIYNPT